MIWIEKLLKDKCETTPEQMAVYPVVIGQLLRGNFQTSFEYSKNMILR